ncbi:exosome non-catalytic core subunit rrp46 [Ciborinia camelliae]|nr:exosome non-catalytic core subunit rrp46 [Ciborinia camelliae]
MVNSAEPTALLSPLPRADGSASFSQNGYTVIGAVNGPIEVQRRDELPEEAAIDVIVRPAAGVGGATPENDTAWSKLVQASSNLPLLPALLQTSVLTLLSASIPLSMTMTSVLLALKNTETGTTITENPSPLECQDAASVHVLAFTSHGELLVSESEGSFDMDEWEEIYEHAKDLCCKGHGLAEDDIMHEDGLDNEANSSLMMFVKSTVQEKVATDLHWKG